MGQILQGADKELINPDDVTEELLDKTMQLTKPDLLVRTSGEVRLSDFMIWQVVDYFHFIREKCKSHIQIFENISGVEYLSLFYKCSVAGVQNLASPHGDNKFSACFFR